MGATTYRPPGRWSRRVRLCGRCPALCVTVTAKIDQTLRLPRSMRLTLDCKLGGPRDTSPGQIEKKIAPPSRTTTGQVWEEEAKPHTPRWPRRIAAYRDSNSMSNKRGAAGRPDRANLDVHPDRRGKIIVNQGLKMVPLHCQVAWSWAHFHTIEARRLCRKTPCRQSPSYSCREEASGSV
jgi:hypothetical protein